MCALFLHDGEYLVLQIRLAHVEERLAGHGGVLHPLLFGQEREHRLHQRAFARCRRRLHDHRQRRFQMSRHHAQIADELVGLLAHDTAPGEVLDDALQQARIAQQLHRLGPVLLADRDRLFLRCERLFDLLVLQLFQLQQHPAQVAADHFFLDAQLLRGLLREDAALPRRVEVERIDVEGGLAARRSAGDEDIHLHQLVTHVFVEATDAITAVALREEDVFAAHLDWHVDHRRGRCRWLLRRNRLRLGG